MFFRKIYLKSRLYLYSKRDFLNKMLLITFFSVFSYYLVNYIIFDSIILGKANYDKMNNKCESAVKLYKTAYFYYGINHFSSENRGIYYKLPYEIAMCYLKENKKQNAREAILGGISHLQNKYGLYSQETAYFIRRYLVEYYLNTNDIRQAKQEFQGLINIYKKIGYDNNIMSDLIRLSGDIYYQQKYYDEAMTCYEKAYNSISIQKNIDYEIFARIVDRICDYEIQNKQTDEAIQIYINSINTLKESGEKQSELAAEMLIRLGDLYQATDAPKTNAINCYEEAITIIKKLPRTTYLKQNARTYLITLKGLYDNNNQYTKSREMDEELSKQKRLNWFY